MLKTSLVGKHVLVVGATQGIGAATAKRFAAEGASVTLIGRNAALGGEVMLALERLAPQRQQQTFAFHQLDVTSIASVKRFCAELVQSHHPDRGGPGLTGLVLCAGGLNFGPRRETAEGVERTFAQNYLSRFVFINELLPLLAATKRTGGGGIAGGRGAAAASVPGGRVVNVLGAATGGAINTSDWQLRSGFSFMAANAQAASMTDVATREFARRHGADAAFFHMFPGIVNTSSARNQGFPWWIWFPASFVLPLIGTPPERIASNIFNIITAPEYGDPKRNGWLVNSKGREIRPVAAVLKGGDELGDTVWSYTVDLAKSL
ncbi:hypothetical protein HK105_201885 [Polyrhizophydium stewartii]|uniref:Uncharacterized protein n=1 Tax=Polyrhizophydium stewartii TaxID=2732419 RepID=A0ABR4NG86_9FUNG|nr:hypothetical protein HK105_007990 [Polyrhizophydium stewartii]